MQVNQHANLLGIFFWVYAAIQGLLILLILGYTGYMSSLIGGIENTGNNSNNADEKTVLAILTAVLIVIILVLICSMILNIATGYGLRKERFWAKRWGIIATILTMISSVFGGMLLMPFGMALGIYGLWFFISDTGKQFFKGEYNI